jgi:hypothetical protein
MREFVVRFRLPVTTTLLTPRTIADNLTKLSKAVLTIKNILGGSDEQADQAACEHARMRRIDGGDRREPG